jgi:hypothetical protein
LSRIKAKARRARILWIMCDRPLILLLVGDQPLREALRFSLEIEGYAVAERPDGRPAAAVIIDDDEAVWPDLGGAPTIVLTGDIQRFLRRGVRGVSLVEKPLLGDALSERLAEILT